MKTDRLDGFVKLIFLILLLAIASGCQSKHKQRVKYEPLKTTHKYSSTAPLCRNPASYRSKVVGDGHCVSLIKKCSGAPATSQWRPGQTVMRTKLLPGTIIATFDNGRYPNRSGHHAAIYISHDASGIWVWDQWIGKAVHKRLIRNRKDRATAGNSAQAYRVVEIKKPH